MGCAPAGRAAPGRRLDGTVAYLVDQQQADGGWNCRARGDKSTHSSFHTSIQALEALHAYAAGGGRLDVREAVRRGHEFFLAHRLYQSHRTGEVAIPRSVRFPAFPEWHFDILRGLEHFRESATLGPGGAAGRDERLGDAVGLLRDARRADGRWPVHPPYAGKQWFRIEPPGPSRWSTARVLIVLKWWEGTAP